MNYMFIKVIFVLNLVFCSAVSASGFLGEGTIKTMQNSYDTWILSVNSVNHNPDGCSKTQTIIPVDYAQKSEVFSVLLAAYTSGKKVNIKVNGCDVNGYKKLAYIWTNWNN